CRGRGPPPPRGPRPTPCPPGPADPPAPAAVLEPQGPRAPGFVLKKQPGIAPLIAFPDGGRTVLVVDDDRVSRRPLARAAWLPPQTYAAACRDQYQSDPHRYALSPDGKLLALLG